MDDNVTITINMDQKCAECGKPGVLPNQVCLKCFMKAMDQKPMKSSQGQALLKKLAPPQRRGGK